MKAFCHLTRAQAALYQQAVTELKVALNDADGIKRRGVVGVMRFKNCNHPSQWLGDGVWREADSGKLARLREIRGGHRREAGEGARLHAVPRGHRAAGGVPGIGLRPARARAARRDRGAAAPAARAPVSGRRVGAVLRHFVEGRCFGLNLTAASHVVHFDRWWNPAVENQATDRAFRIGQTKNVLVHKFLCRGTVEEKIDHLIDAKRKLSEDLLEGSAELLLTEMKDDELLKLVALDLHAAAQD